MAIRQNSSNGKPKSPRIQVVLSEELCSRLNALAQDESRTVSNMAKVLIQEGIKRYETKHVSLTNQNESISNTEKFRSVLEAQEPRRLRGAPRRIRFLRQ
mgnify:CR=1 FL=1